MLRQVIGLQVVTDWQLALMGIYAWIKHGLIVEPANIGVHWSCSDIAEF